MDPEKMGPQFAWSETTNIRRKTANPNDPTTANEERGSTILHRVDLDTIDIGGMGQAHAMALATWGHGESRQWTAAEREHGSDTEIGTGQRSLFKPGFDQPPTLSGLFSTRKGRVAATRSVGIMANLMEGRGKELKPDTNLSPHSAPLVEKVTGEPQKISNSEDFWPEPRQADVSINPGRTGTKTYPPDARDESRTSIRRRIPEDEVRAGGTTLREHMQTMRQPGPRGWDQDYGPHRHEVERQGELFPETNGINGGDTVIEHGRNVRSEVRQELYLGGYGGPGRHRQGMGEASEMMAVSEREHRPMSHEDALASLIGRQMNRPGKR
jgi:hypothetical protein